MTEPTSHAHHRVKRTERDIATDASLTPERGWQNMEVKWLIARDSVGASKTVVGKTVFPPNGRHDLHRHPNAEEWEYVLKGEGSKRVGNETIQLAEGDIVFVPQDVYHALENTSPTEPLITIWGYSGAGSLEEAGYILPADDQDSGERR